jgi:hypothetical protein
MLSKWEKMEESTCKVILMEDPSLENWHLKPFGDLLRKKTKFFGVNFFIYI